MEIMGVYVENVKFETEKSVRFTLLCKWTDQPATIIDIPTGSKHEVSGSETVDYSGSPEHRFLSPNWSLQSCTLSYLQCCS